MAGKIDSCMGYDRYTSLLYSNCQGGILSIQRTENAVTVSYRTVPYIKISGFIFSITLLRRSWHLTTVTYIFSSNVLTFQRMTSINILEMVQLVSP